jgi:hypothetical protein
MTVATCRNSPLTLWFRAYDERGIYFLEIPLARLGALSASEAEHKHSSQENVRAVGAILMSDLMQSSSILSLNLFVMGLV